MGLLLFLCASSYCYVLWDQDSISQETTFSFSLGSYVLPEEVNKFLIDGNVKQPPNATAFPSAKS